MVIRLWFPLMQWSYGNSPKHLIIHARPPLQHRTDSSSCFFFFFHSLLAGGWQTNAPHWRLRVCLHHEHFSACVFLPVLLVPSGCGTELLPTQPLFPWFNLHCLSQLFNISLRNCPHKMSALVKQYIRVAPYVNPTWQDMDHRISVTEGKKSYSGYGFFWSLKYLYFLVWNVENAANKFQF